MNGVKHGHGELLWGVLQQAKQKTEYLQRCFFRTKVNKLRTPRNTYSTIHNRLVSHNAAQRWSLGFKKSCADWAPCQTDSCDGQRTRLSCSSSASCDWQPDTKWREVRLSLYPVIMSLPGICELLLRLLAARCYENPSTPFFCTMSSCHHHPRCHPFFLFTLIYLFAHLFIYFHDFFNFRAASHCRHKKKEPAHSSSFNLEPRDSPSKIH